MMVYRIWHEGYVTVDKGRPLDTVRKTVTASAERFDCDVMTPFGIDQADAGRIDLAFTWSDEDIPITAMLALRTLPSDPRRVDWLLSAASVKPWRLTFIPPSVMLGLDEDINAMDRAGFELTSPRILNCINIQPRFVDKFASMIAGWINDPDRATGFLVLSQDRHPRFVGAAGLVVGIAVGEIGRAALNDRLPTRPIPHEQARLYMPTRDGLPDVTARTVNYRMAAELESGFHQLLHTRGSTPLPEQWREDPNVRMWWTADPFALRTQEPVTKTDAATVRIEQELQEAVQQITILRKHKKSVEDALEEANRQNVLLSKKLTQYAEDADHADLAIQVTELQAAVDRYAASFDEVEAERDALRRENGLLIVKLAHAGASTVLDNQEETREFVSFAELLEAASTELPGIVITADSAPATALDHHPKAPAWRRKAWDALLTLHAYVVARTTGTAPNATHTDVRAFARTGQPGSLISANIIKLGESESVMRYERCRQARIFPVDTMTNPEGQAFFGAHIALERFKNPAPRIHFLDDVAQNGVLYVGYLGEHLPNTKTN